jgi:AraC-like DNA-binding protein
MRQAKDIASFLDQPVGSCVSGQRWLVCCPGARLMILLAWGRGSRDDAEQVMDTFAADLAIGPHVYFIDARRMDPQPDPDAFAAFVERLAPQWHLYGGHVTRCALVLPPGMTAATIVGFFSMASPPFETKFFAEPITALEWAGAAEPARLLGELDRLWEQASGTPTLLFRLRAILDADPAGASVESVGRELGLSLRSLQRRLLDAGTSYRRESNAARLRKAQRLLASTELKITSVALEVGCASSQHLSVLFRKMTGQSPGAWRATHRTGRESSSMASMPGRNQRP